MTIAVADNTALVEFLARVDDASAIRPREHLQRVADFLSVCCQVEHVHRVARYELAFASTRAMTSAR